MHGEVMGDTGLENCSSGARGQLYLVHLRKDLRCRGQIRQEAIKVFVLLEAQQIVMGSQFGCPIDLTESQQTAEIPMFMSKEIDRIHDGHSCPDDNVQGCVIDLAPVQAGTPMRLDIGISARSRLRNAIKQRNSPRMLLPGISSVSRLQFCKLNKLRIIYQN